MIKITNILILVLLVLSLTSCKNISDSITPSPGITNIPSIVKGLSNLGKSLEGKSKVDKEEKK